MKEVKDIVGERALSVNDKRKGNIEWIGYRLDILHRS